MGGSCAWDALNADCGTAGVAAEAPRGAITCAQVADKEAVMEEMSRVWPGGVSHHQERRKIRRPRLRCAGSVGFGLEQHGLDAQVAGGMTAERDEGVIDYQRLIPMSPLAKR